MNSTIRMLSIVIFSFVSVLNSFALIKEPDTRIYGKIWMNGEQVTEADANVSVEARTAPDGDTIATYAMGGLEQFQDYYALAVKNEDRTPVRDPDALEIGDTVYVVVRVDGDDVFVRPYTISARGRPVKLDFGGPEDTDNDGMLDADEIANFGDISQPPDGDFDGDGESNKSELDAGTDPTNPLDTLVTDGRVTMPYVQTFENNVYGWQVLEEGGDTTPLNAGPANTGLWQWGAPGGNGGPDADHTTDSSSGQVAGTVLDGDYPDNADAYLVTPRIVIPGDADLPKLTFSMWLSAEKEWDGGNLEMSVDGSPFAIVDSDELSLAYNDPVIEALGQSSGWSDSVFQDWITVEMDLNNFSGTDIQFRFHFATDDNQTRPGWFIDDFIVAESSTRSFPFVEDFDDVSFPKGWDSSGIWQWGEPTSGPNADHTTGHGQLFGTIIDGDYLENADASLTSPVVMISRFANQVILRFSMWMDAVAGAGMADGGHIEVAVDGGPFTVVPSANISEPYNNTEINLADDANGWSGSDFSEWTDIEVDLLSWLGTDLLGKSVQVRFHFGSNDDGLSVAGWYIDDFSVTDDIVAFWYMADAGITKNVDDFVSHWVDVSGNFNNAGQASASNQPLWILNVLGGQPGLLFDGVDDYLTIANDPIINTGGPYEEKTMGIVFRTGDDVISRQAIWEQGDQRRGLNIYIDGGSLYLNAWNRVDDGEGVWGPLHVDIPVTADTSYFAAMVFDQPTGQIVGYLNGFPIGSITGVGRLYKHAGITVGRISGSTHFHDGIAESGYPFNGVIAEIFGYTLALTDNIAERYASRFRVNRYIQEKYHINESLLMPDVGLKTWLASEHGVVRNTANAVSAWLDHSFNANDFVQNVAVSQPSFNQIGGHGHSVVVFDGVDDFLTLGSTNNFGEGIPYAAGSIALVFETGTDVDSRQPLYIQSGGGSGMHAYIENKNLYVTAWEVDAFLGLTIDSWSRHSLVELGTGEIHYAVLTFDSAVADVRIYLDGVDHIDNGPGANVSAIDADTLATTFGAGSSKLLVQWQFEGDLDNEVPITVEAEFVGGTETYMTGIVGQALQLDGVDDYVRALNTADLEVSQTLSISVWINPANTLSDGFIVGKSLDHLAADGIGIYMFDGLPFFVIGDNHVFQSTGSPFVPGEWHYIVVTYDGSNMRIYIDGALKNTTALSFAETNLQNDANLTMGADDSGGNLFSGRIDEMRVHSRVLSGTEVTNAYNAGLAGNHTALEAIHPLEVIAFNNAIGMAPLSTIFHDGKSTADEFFEGSIAEVAYFNRKLSDESRHVIENHVSIKYALPSPQSGGGRSAGSREVLALMYPTNDPTFDLILHNGWNLVSVPIHPGDADTVDVFSSVDYSSLYGFVNGDYVVAEKVLPKNGYWGVFNVTARSAVSVSGQPVRNHTKELDAGWNLVGPLYEVGKPVDDSINPNIWLWDAGAQRYERVSDDDKLRPGLGYWVYAYHDNDLDLGR